MPINDYNHFAEQLCNSNRNGKANILGRVGENGYEMGLFGEKTYKDPIGETDEKKSLQ